MNLFDHIKNSVGNPVPMPAYPKGWDPGVVFDPQTSIPSQVTTPAIPKLDEDFDWREVIKTVGVDLPEGYELRLAELRYDPAAWHRDEEYTTHPETGKMVRTPATTRPVYRYRFNVVKVDPVTKLDVPSLYAAAKRKPKKKVEGSKASRTTVVCVSDTQFGKTSHRGGTPELLERLEQTRHRLNAHLKKVNPENIVLVEGGDLFENFESGGNPMFTNDLSLAKQMDVSATEIYEFIDVCQKYGHVDVMAVTSNHTAWRRGKQELGHPQDDLGLHVHRTVEKLAQAKGFDTTWHYPEEFSEQCYLNVRGTGIGLVHGNQFSSGQAVKWWQGQQHGGQPVGKADVLLYGHYHHFTVTPSGRNPDTGKVKWVLGMPTLDAGSTWFRNMSGDDSDPGLLVFDITDEGFDLQSMTIL